LLLATAAGLFYLRSTGENFQASTAATTPTSTYASSTYASSTYASSTYASSTYASSTYASSSKLQTSNTTRSTTVTQPPGCQHNIAPIFTRPFTNATMIQFVYPLGGISTGSPARSYVFVKTAPNGSHLFVPVYAPVNMTLQGITYAYRNYGPLGARPEYRLDFQATCEVFLTFDHVPTVEGWIASLGPSVPANNTRTGVYVSVPVQAGELLGYTDGTRVAGSWDFMVLNHAKPAFHVNDSRWTSDQYRYGDCPYDYFTGDVKATYYTLLSASGTTTTPLCGKVSRDVAGTIAGGWFQGNSTTAQGSRLMVGKFLNYIEIVVSQTSGPLFDIRDYRSVVDPATVTVGQSVCYSDGASYAYFDLVSQLSMRAATGTGGCPAQLPSQYQVWNR